MSENPYAAPQDLAPPLPLPTDSGLEAIRRNHLGTESSIKTIGILFYLGFIWFLVTGVSWLSSPSYSRGISGEGVVLLIFAPIHFAAAFGLRGFKPWARIPAGFLCAIGLLWIPVGTVVSSLLLYLIFGSKGRMVFSSHYREIMAATPHIKHKRSAGLRIILAIIWAIIAATILGLIFTASDPLPSIGSVMNDLTGERIV